MEITHSRNTQRQISRHPKERKSQREKKEGEVKLGNTRENITADFEKNYLSVWK